MSNEAGTNNQKKEKMVKFMPELRPGVLEDDINISINGKRWLIPRGQTVEVPEYVYNEYLRSNNAALMAYKNSQKMQYDDPVKQKSEANSSGFLVT